MLMHSVRSGSIAAKRAGLWTVAVPNGVTSDHDFDHVDGLDRLTLDGVPSDDVGSDE